MTNVGTFAPEALMSASLVRLALRVGPISSPRNLRPETAAARTGGAFSPTPPVKTRASILPIAAIEKHKSQFLNLASHELRGPLTVIRGYGSMLQSGLLGHLNDRGQKAAPVMMAKILEMNALIEQPPLFISVR
jgi:signal transduction histidine kinase